MAKQPFTVVSQQSTQTKVHVSLFLDDLLSVEIVDNAQPRLSAIFTSGEINVEGIELSRLFQIRDHLLSRQTEAFEGVPAENIHVFVRSAGGTEL
jgi:hypothetical protein